MAFNVELYDLFTPFPDEVCGRLVNITTRLKTKCSQVVGDYLATDFWGECEDNLELMILFSTTVDKLILYSAFTKHNDNEFHIKSLENLELKYGVANFEFDKYTQERDLHNVANFLLNYTIYKYWLKGTVDKHLINKNWIVLQRIGRVYQKNGGRH